MMERTLAQAAQATGGRLVGPDAAYTRVVTDSRRVQAEDLFVALQGPRFDGHEFVGEVRELAATGAMVSRPVDVPLPQILVPDTLQALGQLAQAWRGGFDIPVVALTGSAGKTTVKEMIRAILGVDRSVLATRGNLNNEIGVPLTLLELDRSHQCAVVEMGASHAGDIAYLTRLAAPTVGVVTNAGPAHLEGFGSLAGVAAAKGELFELLPAEAVAVINADDEFAGYWEQHCAARRRLSFGEAADADFRVSGITQKSVPTPLLEFDLATPEGILSLSLPMAGVHNAVNAAAAAAACWPLGSRGPQIAAGLAAVANLGGRLRLLRTSRDVTLIDDSYNANPASVRAAIRYLATLAPPRWLVLGEMAELGPEAAGLHREMGEVARAAGIERLLAVGPLCAAAAESFGDGAFACSDREEALTLLQAHLSAGATVLVKGSRAAGLERLVAALSAAQPGES